MSSVVSSSPQQHSHAAEPSEEYTEIEYEEEIIEEEIIEEEIIDDNSGSYLIEEYYEEEVIESDDEDANQITAAAAAPSSKIPDNSDRSGATAPESNASTASVNGTTAATAAAAVVPVVVKEKDTLGRRQSVKKVKKIKKKNLAEKLSNRIGEMIANQRERARSRSRGPARRNKDGNMSSNVERESSDNEDADRNTSGAPRGRQGNRGQRGLRRKSNDKGTNDGIADETPPTSPIKIVVKKKVAANESIDKAPASTADSSDGKRGIFARTLSFKNKKKTGAKNSLSVDDPVANASNGSIGETSYTDHNKKKSSTSTSSTTTTTTTKTNSASDAAPKTTVTKTITTTNLPSSQQKQQTTTYKVDDSLMPEYNSKKDEPIQYTFASNTATTGTYYTNKLEKKNLDWQKPAWAQNKVLKSSTTTAANNQDVSDAGDKEIGWEKPAWATKNVLRKTNAGEHLKKGGDIAPPITNLPHMARK